MGIVIDTTLDGPVIHSVSDSSPLVGQIFPGDIIVAVNNIDTRAMSAQAITSLMARTSTRRRKMTVLSPDVSDEPTLRTSGAVAEEEAKEEETNPLDSTTPPVFATEAAVVEEPPESSDETAGPEAGPIVVEDAQAVAPEDDDIASVASSRRSDVQPRIVEAPPVSYRRHSASQCIDKFEM